MIALAFVIAIVIWVAFRVVIMLYSRSIRVLRMRYHTVVADGVCIRIDKQQYTRSGEIEASIIPVFEVFINGERRVVYANVSTVPCIIRKGDSLELLVDPDKNTYIYSDKGLKQYRALKRDRNKCWWLLDVFAILILISVVSACLAFAKG